LGKSLSLALSFTLVFSSSPATFAEPATPVLYRNDTGKRLGNGWVAEFGRHTPGYLLNGFKANPVILPAGTYQYVFHVQLGPGHLGGLFSGANEAIRLEVVDHTTGERVASRAFQQTDFSRPWKKTNPKPLLFSTWGRGGHAFEPRVYWPGLVSMRLTRVDLQTLDTWSEFELRARAARMERLMQDRFLDHGYVVMRDASGQAADLDDTGLWTGLYAAAEACRYQSTHAAQARWRMENSLWALHRLHQFSLEPGTLSRFVDEQNKPHGASASKDTYVGFFFAVGQCWPWIQNPRLRHALQQDVEALATHFLNHDLKFAPVKGAGLNLNPYFSAGILEELFQELARDAGLRKAIVTALKWVVRYFRLMGQKPPATFPAVEKAIKNQDSLGLEQIFIPFLNDVVVALRLIEVNIARSARPAHRLGLKNAPYERFQELIALLLQRFGNSPAPIQKIEDLKILPSQSLHALHILKVAAAVLPQPNRFEQYYDDNLWSGKALLRTTLNWAQWDELLIATLFGEAATPRVRGNSNHLPYLDLWNLLALDPAHHADYIELFERHRLFLHNDLNAMTDLMSGRLGIQPDPSGLGYWTLHHYPESRRGFGEAYWIQNGSLRAEQFGGKVDGYAREPIPPDLRPRDAFLWQRNARSIRGDSEGWDYAPVDYLFVWWLSQAAKRAAESEKR